MIIDLFTSVKSAVKSIEEELAMFGLLEEDKAVILPRIPPEEITCKTPTNASISSAIVVVSSGTESVLVERSIFSMNTLRIALILAFLPSDGLMIGLLTKAFSKEAIWLSPVAALSKLRIVLRVESALAAVTFAVLLMR